TANKDIALEEIVVTGSLIARPDTPASSPILAIEQDIVTETPAVTVEATLNQLPQFVGSYNSSSVGISNAGQANLNLRGLGTNRVLVLLDGRRMQPTSADGAVDVNILPTA